ncbi:MAG: complex I NDUFA9 subunit family protein, partial [Ruegeria sp.]
IIVGMPFGIARIMAGVLDILKFVSFQLFPNNILTRDQVKNLRRDNIVAEGSKGFSDLGIEPVALESVLPEYLWKFRPSGQYDEIQKSARNLQM